MLYYTGIGHRDISWEVQETIRIIGRELARNDWILRSGGASGTDTVFEKGCDDVGGKKEIYLPWPNFNGHNSSLTDPISRAYDHVWYHHPRPESLSKGVFRLHARNSHQVLGKFLTEPSKMVICWRSKSGGTDQALRIAEYFNIPIFNLFFKSDIKYICEWLELDFYSLGNESKKGGV